MTPPLVTEIIIGHHGHWAARIADTHGHLPDTSLDSDTWRQDVPRRLIIVHPDDYATT